MRQQLLELVNGATGVRAARRLCEGCVQVLGADSATIAVISGGVDIGTLGASELGARGHDEVQFVVGEGPGVEAVAAGASVCVADLGATEANRRWPLYAPALLARGVRSVWAVSLPGPVPARLDDDVWGCLNLFWNHPHPEVVAGAVGVAAELARLPLLHVLAHDLPAAVDDPGSAAWAELDAVLRPEIGEACGVVMAQLGIDGPAAVARLRAHAFSTGHAITTVARQIIDHRLHLHE